MKNPLKQNILPLFTAAFGAVCAGLSVWLYVYGRDEQGLYVPGHPAKPLLLLVCTAAVLLLIYFARKLEGNGRYSRLFPPCPYAALGTLAAAMGHFLCVPEALRSGETLSVICAVSGLAAGIALVFLAWCRFKGLRPGFLIRSCVLLHLAVHMLCQYRHWIPMPQLTDYALPLLASVCLVLACYHRTAFDAGMGDRRAYVFLSQCAALFCFSAAVFSEDRIYYLTMLLWALTDQPTAQPLPSKKSSDPQGE